MEVNFLPIGSVVMLSGGSKKVMVTGFCMMDQEDNLLYDYCGVLYPEGVVDSSQVLLFDNSDIDKVYYIGFVNEEEEEFKFNLIDSLQRVSKDKK